MSGKRYTDEFKIEAVRQVTDRGHSVPDVAARLGVTTHSLYTWIRKFAPTPDDSALTEAELELRRVKGCCNEELSVPATYFAKASE